jgi:hypothetical protein
MDVKELRQRLEAGEIIEYSVWEFSSSHMSCCEGCCYDGIRGVDDAIKTISDFVNGHLDLLDEYNRKAL